MNDLIVKNVDVFGDAVIAAQDENGVIWAGVSYFCRGLGLSKNEKDRQIKNVQVDETLKRGCGKFDAGVFDPNNETVALKLDFIPLWLAKISITPAMKENNPELVDKLVKYQLQAKDVLAKAFMPQYLSSDDEKLAEAFLIAQRKMAEKDKKIKQLETETIEMNKAILEMQPKVNYVDVILQSKSTVCTTQIAQDYGMSATSFNKLLKKLGIQHKVGNQWILYRPYISQGYVQSETVSIERSNGMPDIVMHTKWTQKGRLFLYEILKNNGYLPLIEQYMAS